MYFMIINDIEQTPQEWTQAFNEYQKKFHTNYTSSENRAPSAYDAVWSIALALNHSIQPLLQIRNTTLDRFEYHNKIFKNIFVGEMNKLKFTGISVSKSK